MYQERDFDNKGFSMFQYIPGTQDFLDLTHFNNVTHIIRKHLTAAAFHEIMTPLIERTELFVKSLGQETDVISKELYLVSSHHTPEAERTELCLRPEATASAMRAFLNHHIQDRPWNVFTIGPMFRHDRPQKGRYRQFHQANIEIINSTSIAQDVRLITLLDRLFQERFRLKDYALLVNFMGCPEDRAKYEIILRKFINKHQTEICSTCTQRSATNLLRIFDCKNSTCQALYKLTPPITDSLCAACLQEWQLLQSLLLQLSVSYSHAPQLVRGLDYYEKTVFEFVSTSLGAQNTFCGGGRYNRLSSRLGAKENIPAIGAAIGIERMMLLTEETLANPLVPVSLHLIVPMSAEQWPLALQLVDTVHMLGSQEQKQHYEVEALLEGDSLKSMLRQANKRGARTVIIVGSEEQATGTVTVKNMRTSTEEKIKQTALVNYLKQLA
jgi:histidyl-tRNA synthetase